MSIPLKWPWRIGLLAATLMAAAPAWADIAPSPPPAPVYAWPLILAALGLEVVLLRFGFRLGWWKATAAAMVAGVVSYIALMLLGLTDSPPAGPQPPFLPSVFIGFAVLVIVEAPVVFAFVGRQGWRWGVVALLVGNLISAFAYTAARPAPMPEYGQVRHPDYYRTGSVRP